MELASFLVAPFLACRSGLLSFDIRENFHAVDSRTATAKRTIPNFDGAKIERFGGFSVFDF